MQLNYTVNNKSSYSLYQGEDVVLVFKFQTAAFSEYDFSAALSVVAKFQNADGSILTKVPTSLAEDTCSVSLSAAETSGLTPQTKGSVEFIFTFTAGVSIAVLAGALSVTAPLGSQTGTGFTGYISIIAVSADYTAKLSDDIIEVDATAGAVTITIPSATAGNPKTQVIKKTDSTFNIVTIAGGLSTTLNTHDESIETRSNGTNWKVLRRHIPDNVTIYTPTFGNMPTTSYLNARWYRLGRFLISEGELIASATGPASILSINCLPSGCPNIDETTLNGQDDPRPMAGTCFNNHSGSMYPGVVLRVHPTFLYCASAIRTNNYLEGQDLVLNDTFSWYAKVPISGWKS